MASPATSALSPAPSSFPICKGQRRCQLHSGLAICAWNHPTCATRSVRLRTMAQFHEPPKVMMHMNNVRKKLWEVIPHSVKDFPWKKAEEIMLQQLLLAGQEALKWSLLALGVCSLVSDVIYSISRNMELVIPFGLFVGCTMTNFLMETSQELFPISEERGRHWHLLGIGCFFALTKIISLYFGIQGQIFLLHAANGGWMQVLWLWNGLMEKQDRDSGDNSMHEDASSA
ncbi:unnamed protein product [Camellia sinensis]